MSLPVPTGPKMAIVHSNFYYGLNVFKAVAVKIAKYPYKALWVQIKCFISNEKSVEKMASKN
jgi:hypothetical protein